MHIDNILINKMSVYVYSCKDDKSLATKFNGVWEPANNRWRIPVEQKLQVTEYLESLVQYGSDSDDDDIQDRVKHVKVNKLHRSESFDSLENSSDEEDTDCENQQEQLSNQC